MGKETGLNGFNRIEIPIFGCERPEVLPAELVNLANSLVDFSMCQGWLTEECIRKNCFIYEDLDMECGDVLFVNQQLELSYSKSPREGHFVCVDVLADFHQNESLSSYSTGSIMVTDHISNIGGEIGSWSVNIEFGITSGVIYPEKTVMEIIDYKTREATHFMAPVDEGEKVVLCKPALSSFGTSMKVIDKVSYNTLLMLMNALAGGSLEGKNLNEIQARVNRILVSLG